MWGGAGGGEAEWADWRMAGMSISVMGQCHAVHIENYDDMEAWPLDGMALALHSWQ